MSPQVTEGKKKALNDRHGVLCGRVPWQDGLPVFVGGGMSRLEDGLQREGSANLENGNRCLKAAQPWYSAILETGTECGAKRR